MKRLLLLSVLLLTGCFQGPVGPAGSQSFTISGSLSHLHSFSFGEGFLIDDTISVTSDLASIRSGQYPSRAVMMCPMQIALYVNSDSTVESPNVPFPVQLVVQDTAQSDGFHVQNATLTFVLLAGDSLNRCSYTAVFQ